MEAQKEGLIWSSLRSNHRAVLTYSVPDSFYLLSSIYLSTAPEGSRRSPSKKLHIAAFYQKQRRSVGAFRELGGLARPYTPYVEPEVLVVVVAATDIQATTIVAQEVLIEAVKERSRGPPEAGASIVERAIEVVPASNRRKSGYVASAFNAIKFSLSWQSPAFRTDVVSGIIFC